MAPEFFGSIQGGEHLNRDQAVVPFGQIGLFPYISEQHVVAQFGEFREGFVNGGHGFCSLPMEWTVHDTRLMSLRTTLDGIRAFEPEAARRPTVIIQLLAVGVSATVNVKLA